MYPTPSPVQGDANLAITESDDMNGPFSFPMGDDMRRKPDSSLFKDSVAWHLRMGKYEYCTH